MAVSGTVGGILSSSGREGEPERDGELELRRERGTSGRRNEERGPREGINRRIADLIAAFTKRPNGVWTGMALLRLAGAAQYGGLLTCRQRCHRRSTPCSLQH